ncbi:MAG: PolC-type DNA polymerase III [Bacilli bacterium]|nr:PolC-type DNA polymerase III [Bacilli bacterium]
MSENSSKFLEILDASGIKRTFELSNGEIQKVVLCNNSCVWKIHLLFDNILPINQVCELMTKIRNYIMSSKEIEDVRFIFSYRNLVLNEKTNKEYFDYLVNNFMNRDRSISVLKYYTNEVLDDRINIYVGTLDDCSVAWVGINKVKELIKDFGFELIIEPHVSHFEVDTIADKNREIEIRNELADTKAYEEKKRELANMQFNSKTTKERRSNNALERKIKDLPLTSMQVMEFRQINGTDRVIVEGVLVSGEIRKAGRYELFEGIITDYEDSIMIKQFLNATNTKFFKTEMKVGTKLSIRGSIQYDNYARDVVLMCYEIKTLGVDNKKNRTDESPVKRVELHAHTKMSVLDSVMDVEKYVDTALKFGHRAVAVTDHANCHVLPELFSYCNKIKGKNPDNYVKPIAGVEGYFINDDAYLINLTNDDILLEDATFVVFDFETSGFSVRFNEIIEIGAVKIKNGMKVDEFSTFVCPSRRISSVITNVTEITNDDLANAPTIEEVLPKFAEFIEGAILVAHNALFDMGHLYYQLKKLGLYKHDYPCIDTLQMAKAMYSHILKRFNLKDVAKGLKVDLEQQHRALHDAHSTSNVFMKMLGDLSERCIYNYKDINSVTNKNEAYKYMIPSHINILVKNREGLKNFYKIISDSHTTHFYKEARILKSVLSKYRDGLLIGSGCYNGEVFKMAYEKSYEDLQRVIKFYDYVEVQPLDCYEHLVEAAGDEIAKEHIKEAVLSIIRAADEAGIPVVATGDVHQIEKEDGRYREIYMSVARPGIGGLHELAKASKAPPMYFRTTSEMLDAFSFLPANKAYEIVVENTNKIADMIEEYELFPNKLFTPRDDFMAKYGVPSMAGAVRDISYNRAKEIYGENLNPYIIGRLEQELNSIIGNGFSSVYYISHMLVKNSYDNGYVVGSRGSVGSSFVATMMGITEVNPLKPHYVCPHCHFSVFKGIENLNAPTHIIEKVNNIMIGIDLEECACPVCGAALNHDGVDIPFETFLGFKGDKVPDIDLNFSGDYQERAHLFCREVFGIDNAFRAGTIGTVAAKTAYGYVKGYLEDHGKTLREAEIKRIAAGLEGAKRTTGQHPGGIVVIPDDIEYTDLIPVQYPADSVDSSWRTSHYDYHRFESNLLKLDILGHDDPTMIRHLMDFVEKYPDEFPFSKVEEIPLSDKDVISLFQSKDALHLSGEDGDNLPSGTIGVPEFGTNFVRELLKDTKPKNFDEIVKVSGLSHGTDVWLGNAQDLVLGRNFVDKPIPFSEVIGCRDDIMTYLMYKGLEPSDAFKIMEAVRKKDKQPSEEQIKMMRDHDVPEWYIKSCLKIQYMFPKAHATAYVIMALRIGWFKVHRPIYYYAAYFSCRASAFDVDVLAAGKNAIRNKINELNAKKEAKTIEKREIDLLDELAIALEMCLRGYSFKQVDINISEVKNFILAPDKKSLYLPFTAVSALGEAAAQSVVDARNAYPFTSKKDVQKRTKLNKTTFDKLRSIGAMDSLDDSDSVSLLNE